MKKIASMFCSVMIFFTAQSSFGMDEIVQNTDSTNIRETLNKKIPFEELDNLHQRMKTRIPLKEYVERVHNPPLSFSSLLQRIKLEGNEWFFFFIGDGDKDLREKVGDILDDLLIDLVLPFAIPFGPIAKVDADRRREARLAEQNPRCTENLILEACLMDLLEWASKERNRDYFFQLKEAFMGWMFDLQALEEEYGKDYDFQKQLENQKGFFQRLMSKYYKNEVYINPNDIVAFG